MPGRAAVGMSRLGELVHASAALACLWVAVAPTAEAQSPDDDIVTFVVCSTWDCEDGPGIDQKFEIWANKSTPEGREVLRLANEQLTAMERHPSWVPRTPIICHKPQEGPGPEGELGLKNREHNWHCRPDDWAFFRNADKACGGSAGLFDALPERYIGRNFCPWSSFLHRCEGCAPLTGATNGSYLVHFFANATECVTYNFSLRDFLLCDLPRVEREAHRCLVYQVHTGARGEQARVAWCEYHKPPTALWTGEQAQPSFEVVPALSASRGNCVARVQLCALALAPCSTARHTS